MSYEVWSRFQVTKEDGCVVKLRIQDVPENKITEFLDLLNNSVYEETFHKAAGVGKNPKAVEQSRLKVAEFMKDPAAHCTICCVDEDDGGIGQIVGVSATALVSMETREVPYGGKEVEPELEKFIDLLSVLSVSYKKMEALKLTRFYDDRGAYVEPGFRKLGIATELLRARSLACMSRNVTATAAIMTSTSSEKAATKNGWETVLEIDLDDLGHQHGVSFENGGLRKFMIWRNPQFK